MSTANNGFRSHRVPVLFKTPVEAQPPVWQNTERASTGWYVADLDHEDLVASRPPLVIIYS